jgi:HPt (histidine-containing phosphotransfer) domain-containing protein
MTSSESQIQDIQSAEVLNQQLLDQYRQLKSGLLDRLIAAYLEEAPKYFASIRQGVETEVWSDVVAGCHALKSCSGNLGAVRLSRLCQVMENAAKTEDQAEVEKLFSALGPQAFEAEEALKGERMALKEGVAKSA